MRIVQKWQNYILLKDFKGNAEIFSDGKKIESGKEYIVGRRWLEIKDN